VVTADQDYPVTQYQPVYFVTKSFQEVQRKIRDYSYTLSRPFSVRYNPYTECIDVLDRKEKLLQFANELGNEILILIDGLKKLQEL